MNNKNTKNNILHKIIVLLVVFSVTVIDTAPLWINARDVTKEEVHTEGLQEGTKEEEELTEETRGESLEELELEEDNGENKKGEEGNEKSEEIEEGSLEEDTNTISGKTEETGISLMSFNVQNVGSYTPRTKQITGHNSAEYDDGEFRGTLERYVMSGSPADTKTVTGQTSANYNKDGYTGTLTQYLESGLPSDTKHVTGQTSASYNKDGYVGTLTRYVASGSPAGTKTVTNQPSSSYNSGGYTGTLTRYVHSGSASKSKEVTGQTSANYSDSSGYTGTLNLYWTGEGSYTPSDTKHVTNQTSSNYNKDGYTGTLNRYWTGTGSYTPGGYQYVRRDVQVTRTAVFYLNEGFRYSVSPAGGVFTGTTTSVHNPNLPNPIPSGTWVYTEYGPGYVMEEQYVPASDTRVFRYRGDVTRPASDTRVYRYRGTVSTPDTRVYRYQGDVSKPDTRQYAYEGNVTRPDTRVYKYEGNVSKPDTRVYGYRGTVYEIDKDAPEITIVTDGNSYPKTSHSTVVNVRDDYSGVELSQYQWTTSPEFPTGGTWTPFTSGGTITRSTGTDEYYLHIVAQDSEGNISQATSKAFNVENTPPKVPTLVLNTTGYTNQDVIVTINYENDLNTKQYKVGNGSWQNYTSPVVVISNDTIYARETSRSGLTSDTGSIKVTNIDKVAPVLNVTGNPIDWDERDEITLSVVTSDTLSGVRRITLPDNTTVSSDKATYKVTENGDYVFKVEDNAGNITTKTVTVDKLMVHYYLYINDSRGNPVKDSTFELLRDGKVYRTSTTDDKGYLDFGKVPPVGKYTLRQVTNSDGIEIKDPVEIDQDVDNPIEIENPIELPVGEVLEEPVITSNLNTWTNKDVKVTINYSTDSTIKQYKVNDGEWEEYNTPITLTENGTVYARAYDDVGNWSPETSLEVTLIDKVNPNVEIEINTEDWVGDKVELTVIAKDGDSGVQTTTSNQGLERISQETNGGTVRSTYLVKDNGSYGFTVTDTAGNTVTDTYTVNNIDKTVPEIAVNGNPDDWFRDYELNLEIITTDNHSGIKQVTLPDGTVVTGQDLDKLTYKVTDNGSYEFIVEDNVGNKTTYTEEVTRLEKDFRIKVTDTVNKALAGAEFELYRDGELVGTEVSDNRGLVSFGTVYTSGKYEIRQTRVPEGYRINNKIQEVDVTDDDITITNYHQSEELPSTGTMDDLIMLVMGLATITVITVTNKKRRNLRKEV